MNIPTTDTIGTAIFKEAMEREKKCARHPRSPKRPRRDSSVRACARIRTAPAAMPVGFLAAENPNLARPLLALLPAGRLCPGSTSMGR
jgi:hypothetical protein